MKDTLQLESTGSAKAFDGLVCSTPCLDYTTGHIYLLCHMFMAMQLRLR